jgi:hypothetical protein
VKVGDERKNLLRRRLDGRRALHAERVRLHRRDAENARDQNGDDDGNDL